MKDLKAFKAVVTDTETWEKFEATTKAVSKGAAEKELKEWYAEQLDTDESRISVELSESPSQ